MSMWGVKKDWNGSEQSRLEVIRSLSLSETILNQVSIFLLMSFSLIPSWYLQNQLVELSSELASFGAIINIIITLQT